MKLQLNYLKLLIITALVLVAPISTFGANKQQQKAAQKEAKALMKEGWRVNPGALSIQEQILVGYDIQREVDENGMPTWIVADGKSVGGAYNPARMQAITVAKSEIAGMIETEIAAILEQKIGNDDQGRGEAESIMQTIQASKSRIIQKLGRVRTIMECYRELPNGNVEVFERIAMPWSSVAKAIQDAVDEDQSGMGRRLNELMGW